MAAKLSDLVADSKLEIEVFAEHTIQTAFNSNLAKGQRPTREQEKWQRTKQLGEGSFGIVWLEACTAGSSRGKLRAVKELKKPTTEGSSNYYKELEAIAKFSQEKYQYHFVRSFGWYENNNAIFITMEYLELGDLEGYLKARLSYEDARQITQQLLEGLVYMHNNNFAHRDLKPGNILVLNKGPNWWIKIADFGISKRVEGTALRTVIGTEAYLAPEVRGIYTANCTEDDEHTFSLAVDIWAVGAITFRMVTGRLAFPPGRQLFDYVVRGSPFPTEDSMNSEYTKFVTETMAASPPSRPTSQQALSYEWIEKQETPVPSLNSEPAISFNLSTIRPTFPIASAQWSTLSKDVPIMRLKNLNLWETSTKTSSPSIIVTKEQGLYPLQQVQQLEGHGSYVESVVFSPDGCRLASGGGGGGRCGIIIWEADEQGRLQQVQQLEGHSSLYSVAFSHDGRRLASGGGDGGGGGVIIIWEADEQGRLQQVQQLKSHGSYVESVAFSPDGCRLASGGGGGGIIIWEADKQCRLQQVQQLEGHSSLYSVAFSPDGRRLASGGGGGGGCGGGCGIIIWEADEQGRLQQVQQLESYSSYVRSVAFSPNGRRLASGGGGSSVIIIWEADEQGRLQQVQQLKSHGSSYVRSVAFSPDGRRLASGGGDGDGGGVVIIWEADEQGRLQQVQQLRSHSSYVRSVAFSPDGRRLASGGVDKAMIIWEAEK